MAVKIQNRIPLIRSEVGYSNFLRIYETKVEPRQVLTSFSAFQMDAFTSLFLYAI